MKCFNQSFSLTLIFRSFIRKKFVYFLNFTKKINGIMAGVGGSAGLISKKIFNFFFTSLIFLI
jgi:hypothetical protein